MKDRPTITRPAFTFIEVLVALSIAAIALLGLLRLHLLSTTTADTAQAVAQAVFIAQEKMAETCASSDPREGTQSGTVERNGQHFTWRTEIARVGSPEISNLKLTGLRQMRTFVTWQDGTKQKDVQMTTYVADNKIHEQTTR